MGGEEFRAYHPSWDDPSCAHNLAVWVCGIDDLRLLPYKVPHQLGSNDVRVEIKAVGICGSDVHYVKKLRNSRVAMKEPMVLGHESAGVVCQVGSSVTDLKVGDRVALEAGIPCGCCMLCKVGRYNLCRDVRFFGSPPTNGSLAKEVVHPASLCHKIPDCLTFEEGAMCEPLSVGVHACRRAKIGPGKRVLILGAGPIGLVVLLVAKAFGATTIHLTDIDEKRLRAAIVLGADGTLKVSSDTADIEDEVAKIQKQLGSTADVTFDCVGISKTMSTALNVTKSGGKVCLVGMGQDQMTLPLTASAAREVDVLGIFRYCNTYPLCIDLLQSRKVDVRPLITHRYGLSKEEIEAAFRTTALAGDAIKVQTQEPHSPPQEEPSSPVKPLSPIPVPQEQEVALPKITVIELPRATPMKELPKVTPEQQKVTEEVFKDKSDMFSPEPMFILEQLDVPMPGPSSSSSKKSYEILELEIGNLEIRKVFKSREADQTLQEEVSKPHERAEKKITKEIGNATVETSTPLEVPTQEMPTDKSELVQSPSREPAAVDERPQGTEAMEITPNDEIICQINDYA
ncbi:hypothetical protein L7F22_058476 [Adiantum nelumboides]|nr:hypothetical protein [Adiantum nelumboides]